MNTLASTWFLAATAAAFPFFAVLAPKGIAPLFAFAAAGGLLGAVIQGSIPAPPRRLAAGLLAFAAFGALSALWSRTPEQTLWAAVPLAGIFLGTALLVGQATRLDGAGRRKVQTAVLIGGIAYLILLIAEHAGDRSVLRAVLALAEKPIPPGTDLKVSNSNVTVMALFAWPWILVLRHRFSRSLAFAAGFGVLGLLAVMFAAKIETPLLAFILGGAVFFLARRWRRGTTALLGSVLVVGMLGAPWIPGFLPDPLVEGSKFESFPSSAVHRIQIWQTTAAHIRDRPWFGHGLDTARALYPQETLVVRTIPHSDPKRTRQFQAEPIPLHPHNMILQIWLETGLAGALLVLAAFLSVVRALHVSPLQKTERAAGYGFFVTALFIASISYGAWQAWWLCALALNATLMIAAFSRPPTGSSA